MPIFRCGPLTPSTPFFSRISILQKQLKIYLVFQVSLRNGCNNLHYYPHYDPKNLSVPTFDNVNLTESITNLIVAWKFNQKRVQESILHYKPFKTSTKSNSYLISTSRRGHGNCVNLFFPNINVTKAIRNLLVLKITEKMTMIIDISTLIPLMRNRNCFLI